jgi:hypothetical protein
MRRTQHIVAELLRFATQSRSPELPCLDLQPKKGTDEARLAALFRRACWLTLHQHRSQGGSGGVDPACVVRAFAAAWEESGFTDHARFEESLEVAKGWGRRQGVLSPDDLLGLDMPFGLELGGYRLTGNLDRVQRVGGGLRVRTYCAARVPMSCEEIEGSLRLAISDLATAQLYPSVTRIDVELELLRHGAVVRFTRTEEQRDATRAYVVATLDRMASGAAGEVATR